MWISSEMLPILITLLGFVTSLRQCPDLSEASPCTCQLKWRELDVTCGGALNFSMVLDALQGKFSRDTSISLRITESSLPDLDQRYLHEIGVHVRKLQLDLNEYDALPEDVFKGMESIRFLTITDGNLTSVPAPSLSYLPALRTLSLANNSIDSISEGDFLNNPELRFLLLHENYISDLGQNPFPHDLYHLHLGHNKLQTLNGTIRDKTSLEWLFLNDNLLESLDDELPSGARLYFIDVSDNHLVSLPTEASSFYQLEDICAQHNQLESLKGLLRGLRKLQHIDLSYNNIYSLASDEFHGLPNLKILRLRHNHLSTFESSLDDLQRLKRLDLSWNQLANFSLQQIYHLRNIKVLELDHNNIQWLSGFDHVEDGNHVMPLRDLHLEFNSLTALDGCLSGLTGLQFLNLSHNAIETLTSSDFLDLAMLRTLDLSFNRISSLGFIYEVPLLPSLLQLSLANNSIAEIIPDFFVNLPSICDVNLQSNEISLVEWPLHPSSKCIITLDVKDNPLPCKAEIISEVLTEEGIIDKEVQLVGIANCVSEEEEQQQLNEMENQLVEAC